MKIENLISSVNLAVCKVLYTIEQTIAELFAPLGVIVLGFFTFLFIAAFTIALLFGMAYGALYLVGSFIDSLK